jgi:hypothetical protein
MGYRSDVAYVIKFKSMEERTAYVASVRLSSDKEKQEALAECKQPEAEPLITYQADNVKWYDSFADVQAHVRVYRAAYEEFAAIYRFVALGEDGAEDFNHEDDHGELEDYIHTSHSLNVNF